MISVDVDYSGVSEGLDKMPVLVVQAVQNKMRVLTVDLQGYVIANKLQGQVLNHKSGALSRSIQEDVLADGDTITGEVFSSGDVKYAAIHEYGGVIHHPGGTPYIPNANGGGAEFVSKIFASSLKGAGLPVTKPHDITMPERSFLRSSLAEKSDEIVAGIKAAALFGAREALGQ